MRRFSRMVKRIFRNFDGDVFFTDDRLIVAGLGGLTWMSIGAFIMAKMVSFEI